MPRPGPRPYECVKRGWHSDRHQPMRGSIIQQIFRVANETHSSVTKKNREWQEKLPIVVLKAEEIIYSKANSETEYTNLETLWDRVNDAINTIIRREESTETGELLPPCVEAALNLGCVPVRASRSQRHNNPRSYLSPRAQEPISAPPRSLHKITNEQQPQLSPLHTGNQSNFARPTDVNLSVLVSESNSHVAQNNHLNAPCNFPFYEKLPLGHNQFMTLETSTPLNLGSVYPLYFGTHYQTEESQLGTRIPENIDPNTIFVGTPIGTSVAEPAKMCVLQNLFSCNGAEDASCRIKQADFKDTHGKLHETECDLSLRLGLSSARCMSMDKSLAYESDDAGSSSSQEGGKLGDLSPQTNKEYCFFPRKTANDPFESHSSKRFSEGEGLDMEEIVRKRVAPFRNNVGDGKFFWDPCLKSNQFTGQKGPDL